MDSFDREWKSTNRTFGIGAALSVVLNLAMAGGIIAFFVWAIKYIISAFA